MGKIIDLTEKEYNSFYNKFEYSHFLQSYGFGQAMKTRGKQPIYIGMKDSKGKVVAAALLLKRNLVFGFCYYYSPRGFLIDYRDNELLKEFTKGMKEYLKNKKSIYVKINPEIMYQEIDRNANRIENAKNNIDIYNKLLSLGYIHKGFVKLYQNNEPRYTFRRYFDSYKSFDDIKKEMSKSFIQKVNKSYSYNLIVNNDANVDFFFELNKNNATRDGFVQYSDKFYKSLYDECKKNNNINVFEISVNGKELYNNAVDKYEELIYKNDNGLVNKKDIANVDDMLARLKKEIKIFEEYKNNDLMPICIMINGISNGQLWTMYQGNNSLAETLFAVNRIYYEIIKYCFENGYKFMDLYGTVGEPETTYKNLGGLHNFKSGFGGQYIEFIGEFDLVNNKILYKILPLFLKVYRFVLKLKK